MGDYIILGRLGVGGFGAVYVAHPAGKPEELVAVKVLNLGYSERAEFRKRFLEREIPGMVRVRSPYVPKVIGHSGDSSPLWFATELVRGPSLHTVVQRCGPLPEPSVWHLGLGIAEALEAIHRAELVHRDLKPGNVLVVPAGPKVIDFSLVRLAELDHDLSRSLIMGSLGYVPVEQFSSLGSAGPPADVFALGATLVFAATGHPPFREVRDTERGVPNLRGIQRRSDLYEVVSRCLSHDAPARPGLRELKAEFARQAARYAGQGQHRFGDVLPDRVLELIRLWSYQLAEATLATRTDPAAPVVASSGRAVYTRPYTAEIAEPGNVGGTWPRRSGSGTRVQPDTGRPGLAATERTARWEKRLGDWVRAPVVVGYDIAVAASLDGTVVFFRTRDGAVISSLKLGAPIRTMTMIPRGQVLVGDAEGGVYALHPGSTDFKRLYHSPGGGPIAGATAMTAETVYIVSTDGLVCAVDGHTLSHRFLYQMDQPALGPLAAGRGVVYAVSAEHIFVIDIATSDLRYPVPVGALVYSAPVEVAGTLYFAGADGVLWSVGLEGGRNPQAVGVGAPVHSAMACDRELNLLYAGGADGKLRAFDISGARDSKPVPHWAATIGGEITGVTPHRGRLYCAAEDAVVVVDGKSGKEMGRANVRTVIAGAPAVYRSSVYVASLDGFVRCLDIQQLQ